MSRKFWRRYIKSDYFVRRNMIKELVTSPICEEWLKHSTFPEETKEYSFITLLQSYIDDLLDSIKK